MFCDERDDFMQYFVAINFVLLWYMWLFYIYLCLGFYCPVNTSDFLLYPCPSGYYCPENTTSATQYPCPIGTFNAETQQRNASSCQLCSGGRYCSSAGLSAPSGNCRYCSGLWIDFCGDLCTVLPLKTALSENRMIYQAPFFSSIINRGLVFKGYSV